MMDAVCMMKTDSVNEKTNTESLFFVALRWEDLLVYFPV